MCLAIYKPKGASISAKTMNEAWRANPDGAGFVFAKDNKLHAFKSMNQKEFTSTLKKTLKAVDAPFLIHWRWATHGAKNLNNVHPFFVHKNLAFIHNGVINGMPYHNEISDTRFFNMDILQALKYNMKNKAHDKLISSFIGASKLAFLNNKGEFNIINESYGTWKNKVWYSNLNHCSLKQYSAWDSFDEFEFDGMRWKKI